MYKKLDKDLRLSYAEDNYITLTVIEDDGYKPDPSNFQFDGYIYKPFDEIGRYIEPLVFSGNVAKIPFNAERQFDSIYRYNVFITVNQGGTPNKYVIQNGNIEFIYEHRIPD